MKKGNNVATKEVVEDDVDVVDIDEVEQSANKTKDTIEADSEEEKQFESDEHFDREFGSKEEQDNYED